MKRKEWKRKIEKNEEKKKGWKSIRKDWKRIIKE
jgi:hypothetical protein